MMCENSSGESDEKTPGDTGCAKVAAFGVDSGSSTDSAGSSDNSESSESSDSDGAESKVNDPGNFDLADSLFFSLNSSILFLFCLLIFSVLLYSSLVSTPLPFSALCNLVSSAMMNRAKSEGEGCLKVPCGGLQNYRVSIWDH